MTFVFKMIWNSKLMMNSILAIILFYIIEHFYKSNKHKSHKDNTNIDNANDNTNDNTNIDNANDNTNIDNANDNTNIDKSFSDLFKNVNTKKNNIITDIEEIKTETQSKDNIYVLYVRLFISVFISSSIVNIFW